MNITRDIATKVRDTVDAGLSSGLGYQEPGKMCVEAAVCFALGLPHGDDPGCVSTSLRRLKISLNDRAWSSNQARANGLRRLAVAQLGSLGVLDDVEFSRRVVKMTIQRSVSSALRSAAKVNPKYAERLEAAALRCETEGSRESALTARDLAREVRAADAADAAEAAAEAAAYAAYAADADAAEAAAYAADYAAAAAAYAAVAAAEAAVAAAEAADAAARDKSLAQYAEWVVEILIDMKAPGVEWLDLVPIHGSGNFVQTV